MSERSGSRKRQVTGIARGVPCKWATRFGWACLSDFFLKILDLAVRHILIRRKKLIQFIGKPDPKTKHHSYNTYSYTYN